MALARAGAQERLLDRLNDGSERFLPIAAHGRHLLVRKTAIVTAWTLDESEVRAGLETPRYREIPVEVAMSVGPVIEGCLLADTDPLHDRALDNLNRVVEPFVALLGREAITLVNTAHVVSVVERATQRID